MNRAELQLFLEDEFVQVAHGFEDALIGYATVGGATIAVYARAKCIEVLVKRDGMTEDEAVEYFEFNVAGAYVGEGTPAFAELITEEP